MHPTRRNILGGAAALLSATRVSATPARLLAVLGGGVKGYLPRQRSISPPSNPLQLFGSNLIAWYDAQNGVGLSSGKASQWNDLSGNNAHLTQATGANQPVYNATGYNGLPALTFDGAATYLKSANDGINTHNSGAMTVFGIGTLSNGSSSFARMMTFIAAPAGGATADYNNTLGGIPIVRDAGTDATKLYSAYNSNNDRAPSGPITLDAKYRFVSSWDGTNVTQYWNGALKGQTFNINGPTSWGGAPGTGTIAVGAGLTGPTPTVSVSYWKGLISEVGFINRALTIAEMIQLDAWFQYHWGYQPVYLKTTYSSNPASEHLYVLVSDDGITWSEIPNTYVPPPANTLGICTGPSVAWHPTQKVFILTATNERFFPGGFLPSTSFDIGFSRNGHDFFAITQVDCSSVVSGPGAACWAPEWFKNPDGTLWLDANGCPHILVALSSTETTTAVFQIYETHPLNPNDLSKGWSPPLLITGTSLASTMIDPYPIYNAGTYEIWYKNQNGLRYTEMMSSSSLTSGYSVIHSGDWAGWGGSYEGLTMINTGGSNWIAWLDATNALGYYVYSLSTDNRVTWSAPAKVNDNGVQSQHGTVIPNPGIRWDIA